MIGQTIGGYRILRVLGEGGMGVVYEGVREDIGGSAAIKVLKTEYALQPELAARFFNEARAANLVNHPGIVKVFDYGQLPSGAAFLAMEYLEGESLHKRLQRELRLSEAESLRLGRQIASALAAAHEKQVVHRDLKPENVFIVPDAEAAGGERAKLLDFGIAKLTATQQGPVRTHTNMLMGTPIYMSPEQCRGSKSIGDRTDVYSFGVMLYEMLAGRPPFVAEDPGEYIGQHIYKDPPRIGSLVPSVAPALQRLVDSMLLKDPQTRPSMAAVARVLKELGNFSSDVVTVRALMEAQAETVPRLRALPQTEAARVPDSSPAVWNAPTDPARADADAASARASSPSAVPPYRDPGGSGNVARTDLPIIRKEAGKDVPGTGGAGAANDTTQLLAKEAVPGPGASAGGQGMSAQPAWQTLNVVKAVPTEIFDAKRDVKLDAAAQASAAAERRRKPSLLRTLRRWILQSRRQILNLFGVSLPAQRGSPEELRLVRFWNRVLGIGVLLILLLAAALVWALWTPTPTPRAPQPEGTHHEGPRDHRARPLAPRAPALAGSSSDTVEFVAQL